MTDDIRSDGPYPDHPSSDTPADHPSKGDHRSKDGVSNDGVSNDGVSNDGVSNDGVSNDGVSKDGVSRESGFDPLADSGGLGGTGLTSGTNEDELGGFLRDGLLGERLLRDALALDVTPVTNPTGCASNLNDPTNHLAAPETDRLGAVSSFEGLYLEGSLDNPEWCRLVLEQPELRAELCDLGLAIEDQNAAPADLRPHVKQAALLAFERAVAVSDVDSSEAADGARSPVADPALNLDAQRAARVSSDVQRSTPLVAARTIDGGRRFGLGWRAAAALVLVALGVTIVAVGSLLKSDLAGDGDNLAEAGITLASVTTHRSGAMPTFESRPGWVRIGTSFVPEVDQVLVFGLGESAWLRVREGDRLAVAATTQIKAELLERARADLKQAGRDIVDAGMLRLEAGEALLSSAGQRPVLLAVTDDLLLVLWNGACHVAIDPGVEPASTDGGVGPALALQAGARAIVYRSANGEVGARSFELAGPRRVLLGADGPKAFGTPAASQFRDLELFGGPLVKSPSEHQVHAAATLWRRLSGAAQRANGRFRVAAGTTARLAFTPQQSLYGATALRLWLRAPKGTLVRVVRGAPLKDGASQAAQALGTAELTDSTQSSEPGLATVTVPLPADWLKSLGGDELVLEITTPKSGAPAAAPATADPASGGGSFEGVAFVMGARK